MVSKKSKGVLAENVAAILGGQSQNQASKDSRTSGTYVPQTVFSTIIAGKGCTLDTLDRVAKALKLEPYQLLIPGLPAAKEAQKLLARLIEVNRKMEADDESDTKGPADSPPDDSAHDGRGRRRHGAG